MARDLVTNYVKLPTSHLTKKQKKELETDMKRKGYVLCSIFHDFYVFSREEPKEQKRFGVLSV